MNLYDIVTPMTMDEAKATKQRLDAKCWKGKHKEGTKVKGGVRVNNCVPNESVAEDSWHAGDNAWSSDNHEMFEGHLFSNGDQVELKPEYADRAGEVYTVSQCDAERGRCWIGDEDGRGWYARFDQLIPSVNQAEVDEGWSDAVVSRRTGRPRTPYSVYIKGKKWKDFANDDHAEAVANKLRAKFQADGRDPSVITIAATDYDKGVAEADETSWTANSAQFRKEEDLSWTVEVTLEPRADINQGRGRQVKTMTVTAQSKDAAKKKLADYYRKNGWAVAGIKFAGDLDEGNDHPFDRGMEDARAGKEYNDSAYSNYQEKEEYRRGRIVAKQQKKKGVAEAVPVNDLLGKVTKDANKLFKKAKAGKLKSTGKDFTKGEHWTGPDKDDPSHTRNFGHGYPDTPDNRSHDRYVNKSLKKGVAEATTDQVKKVFKKNGKPVGEVGIDPEASPGVGQWYMKCYSPKMDYSGYDSFEEAVKDLGHCLSQGMAEAANPAQQAAIAIAKKEAGKKPVKESYWTKLQNERNTKLNSLVNELKESINK